MDHKFNDRLNGHDTHIIVAAKTGGPVPLGIVEGGYEKAQAIVKQLDTPAFVWGNAPTVESADDIEG